MIRAWFFILTLCPVSLASEWNEIKSPHFTVITDGGVKEGKQIAFRFEQMREVMSTCFPELTLDTGKDVLIVAPFKRKHYDDFLPELHGKRKNAWTAGFFSPGKERHYALIHLGRRNFSYNTILHEYLHLIQRLNYKFLPHWLSEGMAELFSTVKVDDERLVLGLPLRGRLGKVLPLIPMDQFIGVTKGNLAGGSALRANRFYGQAWALTHYSFHGAAGRRNDYFDRFMAELENNTPHEIAFDLVFGDPDQLTRELTRYVKQKQFNMMRIDVPLKTDDLSFLQRELSDDAVRALKLFWKRRFSNEASNMAVPERLAQLTHDGDVQELVGLIHQLNGNQQAAEVAYIHALRSDDQQAIRHFLLGALPYSNSRDVQRAVNHLRRAIALSPAFSDAYYELARKVVLKPGAIEGALAHVDRAIELERGVLRYRTLRMRLLIRLGNTPAALEEGRNCLPMAVSQHTKNQVRVLMEQAVASRGSGQ